MSTTTNQSKNKNFTEAINQRPFVIIFAGIILVLAAFTAFALLNGGLQTASQASVPPASSGQALNVQSVSLANVNIPKALPATCYANSGLIHACQGGWNPEPIVQPAYQSLPEACYSSLGLIHACESGYKPTQNL